MTTTDPVPTAAPTLRVITLRRPAECACGSQLAASTRAGWDRQAPKVTCLPCLANSQPAHRLESRSVAHARVGLAQAERAGERITARPLPEPAAGGPGASLQREYERRSRARELRVKAEHRYLGGLILALTQEPHTTKSFATGANGERRAAAKVVKRAGPDVLFLFNRRLGAGRRDGDIDMLAVGPAGVYVVDVKCYPRAQIEVRHTGPLRSQRQHLMVRGRDETDLLDSLGRQVLAVRAALAGHPYGDDIPISSAFCFMDATLPVMTAHVSGVPLLEVRGTAKLVSSAGVLDAAGRAEILSVLAHALPPAW